MSSSELIRWGGPAAMLAGVAFVVMFLVQLMTPGTSPGSFSDVVTSFIFIVALLLLLVGLTGFHALQKDSYGRIGRAGLYTVIVATLVQILAQIALLSGNTAAEVVDLLGLFGVMIGFVLYGAATLQARVLPRWCGIGFIIGLPVWIMISLVSGEYGGIIGGILFGLLWLALGYVLWSRGGQAAPGASRVR